MKIKFRYCVISATIRDNGVSFPWIYTLYHASIYDICRQDGNLLQSIQQAMQHLALDGRKGSEIFAEIQSLQSTGFNPLLTQRKHQGKPWKCWGAAVGLAGRAGLMAATLAQLPKTGWELFLHWTPQPLFLFCFWFLVSVFWWVGCLFSLQNMN